LYYPFQQNNDEDVHLGSREKVEILPRLLVAINLDEHVKVAKKLADYIGR
jgi:hypothetical protein